MISLKKYPNRRLSDTSRSQYVNLDYIKTLINDRKDFEVVDSKSEEDITKSLLQIISESESNVHHSLLTNTLLKQLIRFYDSEMKPYVCEYLEQSLVIFIAKQDKMQGMMKHMVDSIPFTIFSKIVEQNMETWSPTKKSKKYRCRDLLQCSIKQHLHLNYCSNHLEKQSSVYSSLMSERMSYFEKISQQRDMTALAEANKAYMESVQETVSHTAESSYTILKEAQ